MKLRMTIWGLLLLVLVTAAALSFAGGAQEQDRGPAEMTLPGGSRGKVPFPHHQHQQVLDDCNACHDVFPQMSGSIEGLKSQGKLEPKYVMNKLCTSCHREQKRAGAPSGPTTCSQCHVRET
jgi:hypothetical protein